jgi:crossover junction endodeoxyribonuclease RuvC
MATTGYGVVDGGAGADPVAVALGTVELGGRAPTEQLAALFASMEGLIGRHRPDAVAVERVFHGRNVRTAMGVGQARGVVLLAAARAGCAVYEYTPTEVKRAVTGYGGADKAQVQAMVGKLLQLPAPPRPDDAADALAVALCCLQSRPLASRFEAARGEPGGLTDPEAPAGRRTTSPGGASVRRCRRGADARPAGRGATA